MPRNQVSVEEIRVRIMKLKQEVDWEPTPYQAEKDMAQKYLSYALDILDEYRFQGLTHADFSLNINTQTDEGFLTIYTRLTKTKQRV